VNALTRVEFLILTVLEEAGEEEVAVLTNAVLKMRRGSPTELDTMIDAVTRLLEVGFVETGILRDEISLQWRSLPEEESLANVAGLRSKLQWSAADQWWRWHQDTPRLQILLTDLGKITVHKILREEGWPPEIS
jgi:hypothetical protein